MSPFLLTSLFYCLSISLFCSILLGVWYQGDGPILSTVCRVQDYLIQSTSNSLYGGWLEVCSSDNHHGRILAIDGFQQPSLLRSYLETIYPLNSTLPCYHSSKHLDVFYLSDPHNYWLLGILIGLFGSGSILLIIMIVREARRKRRQDYYYRL